MIPAIAPLTTSHSRQSSAFVPTMMSTCAPARPRSVRSGAPGTMSPSIDGLPRHHAGHHRLAPALRVRVGDQLGLQLGLRRQQPLDSSARNRLTRRGHAEFIGQVSGDAQRVRGRRDLVRRAALQDRPPEESLGARHREQHADAHCAGGFPEDRDVAGVPAEGVDVLPHPLQRRDLVKQSEVGDPVVEIEESLGAGPPVDDDADDAVPGEVARRRRPPSS